MQDWTLDRQLDFACAAAAINCLAEGARGGIRPIAEIEALMARGERYRDEADIRAFAGTVA
jgi:sugar/nucleoside kinase (ribokinase family)